MTREDIPPRDRILTLLDQPVADAAPVRGCPFIDAAAEFPDPESAVHSYAREQKPRMVQLIGGLVAELGCRAMVLDEEDVGQAWSTGRWHVGGPSETAWS